MEKSSDRNESNDKGDTLFPIVQHPLASLNWLPNCRIWDKKLTVIDLDEILDSMQLEGRFRETARNFALKEILLSDDYSDNSAIDEEELFARLSAFTEGFKAAGGQF